MKNKILAGASVAFLSYVTLGKIRKWAEVGEGKRFEWIDASDEDESEPLPMFRVDDELHLFDPHVGALYTEAYEVGPVLYAVTAVRYDEEDEVFRYQLTGFSGWVSEDWLSLPYYSKFSKSALALTLTPSKETEEVTPELREVERKILDKSLDDHAKAFTVDYLLDVMVNGTAEEKAEAERLLTELTKVGGENG